MRTFAKLAGLVLVGSMLASCGGQSTSIPTQTQPQSVLQPGAPSSSIIDQSAQVQSSATTNRWTPIFTTLPAPDVDSAALDRGASATIPFYTSTVKSPLDGKTYTYRIVGTNPHTSKVTTSLKYVPIILDIKFPDGTVLNPAVDKGCGDTATVASRFFNGPNFIAVPLKSNGVSVGTVQLTDAEMRAEFWSVVKGSAYNVNFSATAAPIVVKVTAPAGSTTQAGPVCTGPTNRIGIIDINAYDSILRTVINAHTTTTEVPVLLSYNTVQTESGQCCVIGYHSAYTRTGGTQVYGTGAYTDQIFGGTGGPNIRDIYAWTHELGELANDPFINNATPLWGKVGQVTGCQGNLEVGDPLTGTKAVSVPLGGFTYHAQELAFFDWFYRTPAEGTGGEYSFEGTFETAQPTIC